MNAVLGRFVSLPGVIAVLVLAGAGLLVAQERHRQKAQQGPWRVVVSKPIVGLGFTAGKLYREHEYVSAMFNQLLQDGLEPVNWQVITDRSPPANGPILEQDRLLVWCRSN